MATCSRWVLQANTAVLWTGRQLLLQAITAMLSTGRQLLTDLLPSKWNRKLMNWERSRQLTYLLIYSMEQSPS